MKQEEEEDLLTWLQNWYYSQCGDEEEYYRNYNQERDKDRELYQWAYGISIETIDNPGWDIEIDLQLTSLANKPFTAAGLYDTWHDQLDNDWYTCSVQDGKFHANGGPQYLTAMIRIFKEWALESNEGV